MIKLFFCGDVVCTNSTIDNKLVEEIQKHDIKCCNFEAPIIEDKEKNKTKKIGPIIFQTKESAENIRKSGFNLINIANNHIMDYGKEGLNTTLECFKEQTVIGASLSYEKTYKAFQYEKEGVKISFLSFAEKGFGACINKEDIGYAWMRNKNIKKIIEDEKAKSDFLIVNCHAGAELFSYPLPEIRELYKKFIDWGVDIVIGHHPHVIQGEEQYKTGRIFYSLGNFVFDNKEDEWWRASYSISISIKDKKSYEYRIIPCILENGQVSIDNNDICMKKFEEYSKNLLDDEKYKKCVDEFCEKMYETTYKKYYENVCGINTMSLKSRIKSAVKILLKKNLFNDEFLYHNLEIETHLWICSRALKNRILKGEE